MKNEELENNWRLSSYNKNTEEQLDYYLDLKKHGIEDIAYLYSHEDGKLTEMTIVNIIVRSDDPKYYDSLLENDDILIKGEEMLNADTSAEFITDYDCYLVWFVYSKKHNWIIATCNTDCEGVDIYRFSGTIYETKEKILSMITEDIKEDEENYEHGSEKVEDIKAIIDGIWFEMNGYASFSDYHIEYTAIEVNNIRRI